MTFEQCDSILTDIRRKQGTSCPLVRIDYAGMTIRGRLARADSDPANREAHAPFGILILESPGLCRAPETIIQIANIPENGLQPLDEV